MLPGVVASHSQKRRRGIFLWATSQSADHRSLDQPVADFNAGRSTRAGARAADTVWRVCRRSRSPLRDVRSISRRSQRDASYVAEAPRAAFARANPLFDRLSLLSYPRGEVSIRYFSLCRRWLAAVGARSRPAHKHFSPIEIFHKDADALTLSAFGLICEDFDLRTDR